MLKMMIADDERTIRKGIKTSINWASKGIKIVAEAANGKEALAKIEKIKPEIIIMDIRMPKINGLEVCQQALAQYPNLKIIILSGYDDFSYAQKAIELGVSDYLLKPFGAEELIKKVNELQKDINKEQKLAQERYLIRKSSKKIFSMLINDILSSSKIRSELKTNFDKYKFNLAETDYRGILIDLDCPSKVKNNDQNDLQVLQKEIINIFNKIFKDCFLVPIINKNYLFGIIKTDTKAKLKNKLSYFQAAAKNKTKLFFSIFIGKLITNLKEFRQSYCELSTSITAKFYQGTDSIIFCPQKTIAAFKNKIEFQDILLAIEEEFYLLETKKVENEIKDIFKFLKAQKPKVDIAKYILIRINNKFIEVINKSAKSSFLNKKYLKTEAEINQLDTINKLEQWQFKRLDNYFKDLDSQRSKRYNKIVTKAVKFVHSNYQQDISLGMLANYIHVSPNYFSKVFKEETGDNFIEWLNKYRIEKSKNMLLDTDQKCYLIAEQVGYNDYRYFSYNFRKYTNISPRQFRKKVKSS